MSIGIAKRLITVEEYHKMAEVGILTEDDRVELINGEIYAMSPITSLHAANVKGIRTFLQDLIGNKAVFGVQDPIVLGGSSEPEPDISVLHFRKDFYAEKHPTAEDIYFLIEVSMSTVRFDKNIKGPLYASSNIPEYWIVNLEKEQIEIYRNPKGNQYMERKIYREDDSILLENFGAEIEVSDII